MIAARVGTKDKPLAFCEINISTTRLDFCEFPGYTYACYMDHTYELVVVTGADGSDTDRKNQIDEIKKLISEDKSEVESVQEWGKKELAYPIQKQSHGHYSLITFKGNPNTPQAIKSKLNLNEKILRYMVVRKEEIKVKSKDKKQRSEK